jgi:hypothetical protein
LHFFPKKVRLPCSGAERIGRKIAVTKAHKAFYGCRVVALASKVHKRGPCS